MSIFFRSNPFFTNFRALCFLPKNFIQRKKGKFVLDKNDVEKRAKEMAVVEAKSLNVIKTQYFSSFADLAT